LILSGWKKSREEQSDQVPSIAAVTVIVYAEEKLLLTKLQTVEAYAVQSEN